MGGKFQTTSAVKVCDRFTQKICIALGRVSTKVVQRIVDFQIFPFC